MNKPELTYLTRNPNDIDDLKTRQLDEVIQEFPYFQAARAIQLKGLHKTNSFKYNQALKKTASYTIDRTILFEFITSQSFGEKVVQKIEDIEEITVVEAETVQGLHQKITDSIDLQHDISEKPFIQNQENNDSDETSMEILELGAPIPFKSNEPHSFNEWMQLISQKPIVREEKNNGEKSKQKLELIDRFIASNPKLKPIDKLTQHLDIAKESTSENDNLMTETLAKVYLEQKKYANAIKAYRILSLKYPEKSGFFADRIKAIKILQKNKS